MAKPNKRLVDMTTSLMGIDEIYDRHAAGSGIAASSFWILYSLWMYDGVQPCTQRQLCREWSMSPQTINSSLRKMQGQGLVSLETSSTDKREKLVSLTDDGRARARDLIDPLIEAEERAFLSVPEEEREATIRALEAFRCNLKRELS